MVGAETPHYVVLEIARPERKLVTVDAVTRFDALKQAEREHPGWRAVAAEDVAAAPPDEMIERAARAMAELHLPQFGWLDLDPADHENWKILARVGIEAALRFREADSDCCLGESTTGYAGSI
jgi:hypothetical protein